MSEETPACHINVGDTIRFSPWQYNISFGNGVNPSPLDHTEEIEGPVLMVTRGIDPYPDEVCLSLPQGNFWFNNLERIQHTGQATPEELDFEYTATYGEGHPDHA